MQHTNLDPVATESVDTIPAGLSPWAVQLDDVPIEGGFDDTYGDALWQTLICADRMQSNGLVLGMAQLPAFGILPLHRHAPAEFYYFQTGSAQVTIDGVVTQAVSGMAIFIPGNAEHGIIADAEGCTFLYGFPETRFSDVTYNFSQQQDAQT